MHSTHIAYYLGRKKDNPETHWLDRLICLATRSKYSHVELVYDYSLISKIGLTWSSSPRDGGVRPQRIDFSSGHWELYHVPTRYNEDQILSWFNETRVGKKYDWFGAFGAFLPIFGQDPLRWFCSEIVASCLGIDRPHELTPGDLHTVLSPIHTRVL
jgi:hypothetical protein